MRRGGRAASAHHWRPGNRAAAAAGRAGGHPAELISFLCTDRDMRGVSNGGRADCVRRSPWVSLSAACRWQQGPINRCYGNERGEEKSLRPPARPLPNAGHGSNSCASGRLAPHAAQIVQLISTIRSCNRFRSLGCAPQTCPCPCQQPGNPPSQTPAPGQHTRQRKAVDQSAACPPAPPQLPKLPPRPFRPPLPPPRPTRRYGTAFGTLQGILPRCLSFQQHVMSLTSIWWLCLATLVSSRHLPCLHSGDRCNLL